MCSALASHSTGPVEKAFAETHRPVISLVEEHCEYIRYCTEFKPACPAVLKLSSLVLPQLAVTTAQSRFLPCCFA
eukprot:s1441_g13.t1